MQLLVTNEKAKDRSSSLLNRQIEWCVGGHLLVQRDGNSDVDQSMCDELEVSYSRIHSLARELTCQIPSPL